MVDVVLRILETPQEMARVEELQRLVWPGNETEIVPAHMLLAAVHNGGLVVGAFTGHSVKTGFDPDDPQSRGMPASAPLVGFVFGFPGIYFTPDGPRLKHCSHMLAVHPDFRDQGIGFLLKRSQWQMVRHQGLDRITWTYDPLLSRNAYLNIARLGAVCDTYRREEYGEMRDSLNAGLPSDRFQVDWWINTKRVERRLSSKPRLQLDLAHFLAAGAEIINPSKASAGAWPQPVDPPPSLLSSLPRNEPEQEDEGGESEGDSPTLLLIEIPADFLAMKVDDLALALEWRLHSRALFEGLFGRGYLVTDFIYLPGTSPRSFYVLSHGESTL